MKIKQNAYPSHSVIIITYNQEELIGRAIDSLLCQKELLYEIIISDDCSRDNTWQVIQNYTKHFPELIKSYQNEQNLGIFGNIESTWTKPSGDIIWYLSGDDEFCDGLFHNANSIIIENKIDFENDLFTIYFNWKASDPNGKVSYYSNELITKYSAISLKIRGLITNRTTGISKNVLKKFKPVRKDIGLFADGLIDIQTQLFSEKNYYGPFIGSVYYSDIGIGKRTKYKELYESYLKLMEEYLKTLKNLPKSDYNWLIFQKRKTQYRLKPGLIKFLFLFINLIKIIEIKYGIKFYLKEVKSFCRVFLSSIMNKI